MVKGRAGCLALIALLILGGLFAANRERFFPPPPAEHIVDLIARGDLEATASGLDLGSLYLTLVNKTDHPVRVSIPSGTFFRAPNENLQNMVAVGSTIYDVPARGTYETYTSAVCANLFRSIPGRSNARDLYTFERAPEPAELARLIPVLEELRTSQLPPPTSYEQAAIWIVSDNATYNQLGILISVPMNRPYEITEPDPNARLIKPIDVLDAIDALDRAGIDVRARGIWADLDSVMQLTTPPIEGSVPSTTPASLEPIVQTHRPFRDCPDCPEMIQFPDVNYAIGRYEVTYAQWDACVEAGGCNRYRPPDDGLGRGQRPVAHVSFNDAQAYVRWLSRRTHHEYSLPYAGQWNFALLGRRNIRGERDLICEEATRTGVRLSACMLHPAPAPQSSEPSAVGVYDMPGNVWEWVDTCFEAQCDRQTLLGGAPYLSRQGLPPDYRSGPNPGMRDIAIGFRVGRSLPPPEQH